MSVIGRKLGLDYLNQNYLLLCGRQSCFLVWAIRRELDRLDAAYPPTDPMLRSWMQARLYRFRIQVGASLHAARRGRWKWARDHRPEPLSATEEECLLPAARGWVWVYNDADLLWYAVTPSAWPHDPPPGDISTGVVVQYAREHGYSDMEIISFLIVA